MQPRPMATPVEPNQAQSNTTTWNGNGLIGDGGGGGGSNAPINSLTRERSIYSDELDSFYRSLMQPGQTPGQTFGSLNVDELVDNDWWTMEEIQALQDALAPEIMEKTTKSGEGGRAGDRGNVLVASENGGDGALIRQPSLVCEPCLFIPRTNGSGSPRNPDAQDFAEHFVAGVEAFKQGQHDHFSKHFADGVEALKQKQAQALAQAHHKAHQQQQASEHWLRVQQQQAQQAHHHQAYLFQQQQVHGQQAHHHQAYLFQQQQVQGQQAHHQAQLFQAEAHPTNGMYNGVGNGGLTPNMNFSGYTGMDSVPALQLGQMGMQSGLALPAQSPASEGGAYWHSNGLSSSPVGTYGVEGSIGGKKRGADREQVERRHRRVIKNRETAQKSRALKRAQFSQLEAENTQLKAENDSLRKEMEEIAQDERLVQPIVMQCKKKLRRTSSAPF